MNNDSKAIPLYQKEFYEKFYDNEKNNDRLSRYWVQKFLTLGAAEKMNASVVNELKRGMRVLQLGLTFGPLIADVADKISSRGQYDIIDINPKQIQRAKREYSNCASINLIHHNAEFEYGKDYDAVICYNLLHEVPLAAKIKIVENALSAVCGGGKVIFVDYHRPAWYNPLRWFVKTFNRLYQPFAEKLWDLEVSSFTRNSTKFNWRKNTYSGKMYQKVVAIRKQDPAKQFSQSFEQLP